MRLRNHMLLLQRKQQLEESSLIVSTGFYKIIIHISVKYRFNNQIVTTKSKHLTLKSLLLLIHTITNSSLTILYIVQRSIETWVVQGSSLENTISMFGVLKLKTLLSYFVEIACPSLIFSNNV